MKGELGMAKNKNLKPKRSKADTIVNVIITLVVVAVLALAIYAIADKFKPDIYTLSDAAAEQGMSLEDFSAEYGIEGAEADTDMNDVVNNMSLENFAKLSGTTFDELVAQGGLPEGVTADMTVAQVQEMLTVPAEQAADEQDNSQEAE